MQKILTPLLAALVILVVPQFSVAAQAGMAAAESDQRQVYGWELMSEQERTEYRTKMRNLQTDEERERYRAEHHEQMRERAEKSGVTLPEAPMPMGRGAGPGGGAMPGMGMGKGMGGGGGPKR